MEPFEMTDGVVLLRAPDSSDVDRITTLCQDPAIQEWTTVPSPYGRTEGDAFVAHVVSGGWAAGTACTWAVRDAGTDELLGMVGLTLEPVRSAELGFWLSPSARGRGLMSRSVALVLDVAFGALELDRLVWRAFVGNEPSRRVAERAGFRVEGEIRGGAVHRGARRDDWIGTLLRTDPRPAG